MSGQRVSIIIVPPGGAPPIQLSISVFRAKLFGSLAGLVVLGMVGTTAVGLSLWDSAARGRALEVENDSLRVAITRMSDLDRRLADLERKGGLIRELLEVDQDESGSSPGREAPTVSGTGVGESGEVGYAEVGEQ